MVKTVKKTAFRNILLVMACMGAIAGAGIYYLGEKVLFATGPEGQGVEPIVEQLVGQSAAWLNMVGKQTVYCWAIPGVIVFFLLIGGVVWMSISSLLEGEAPDVGTADSRKPASGKKDFIDHKIEQERRQRLFLHTLSILQREGRLLDFFDEDLSRYEDTQIGAAVRSIQEDCKKAVKKYIDLRPVLQGNEGDPVTIEEGFDLEAINLVGNVAGKPPFNGVIKHPGWKAGKNDVPKLSDIQDSAIMTPAEVEIQ